MDKLIVTFFGLIGVMFTYWFFLGNKDEGVEVNKDITITVEGGYKPSHIIIKKNHQVTLHFIRKDPNPCLEEIVIPDLKIRKYLPLNETVNISFAPKKSGDIPFSCGMNMYHGRITIK